MRPKLLVGTNVKLREYNTRLFDDLHYWFRTTLRCTRCLIVAGYGFRDDGINYHLLEWIYTVASVSVILIHHDPKKLRGMVPDGIGRAWDALKQLGKWKEITKRVEDLERGELDAALI